MINEIILHVGLHKTGTSSIQHTLYKNRKFLIKQGFLYPSCWGANHSIPVYSIFCDNPVKYPMNIKDGLSHDEIKEKNNMYLDEFKKEVIKSTCKKIIISGEDISMLTIDNLNKLRLFLLPITENIKVILYVRHPVNWAVSAIQQKLKGGFTYTQSFSQVSRNVGKMKDNINKFINVFSEKQLEVYEFEDAAKQGLIKHFLNSIGCTHIDEINTFTQNVSMSLIGADILNYINEKAPMIINGVLNKKRLKQDFKSILNIRGPKFDIPLNDKNEIVQKSLDNIKWFKEKWGIEYKTKLEPSQQLNYTLTDEIVNDIKKAYWQVPDHLKGLIMEYLADKLSEKKDH